MLLQIDGQTERCYYKKEQKQSISFRLKFDLREKKIKYFYVVFVWRKQ